MTTKRIEELLSITVINNIKCKVIDYIDELIDFKLNTLRTKDNNLSIEDIEQLRQYLENNIDI